MIDLEQILSEPLVLLEGNLTFINNVTSNNN